MKDILRAALAQEHLNVYAPLPLSLCHITRAYLLERLPFTPVTVIPFLIPYYTGETENLSRYAAAGDYHAYAKELFDQLCPSLSQHTGYGFAGFADHAPLDERHAAALAGLGMRGDNGLLIHECYGSFVFIAELLTDLPAQELGYTAPAPMRRCAECGACRAACPTGILRGEEAPCLSALTQQKGDLTEQEIAILRQAGSVWGCDACQMACPYNVHAIQSRTAFSPIPFFWQDRITRLTPQILRGMDDATFRRRAFSFRGRQPLERNMALLGMEADDPTG